LKSTDELSGAAPKNIRQDLQVQLWDGFGQFKERETVIAVFGNAFNSKDYLVSPAGFGSKTGPERSGNLQGQNQSKPRQIQELAPESGADAGKPGTTPEPIN